MSSVTFLDFVNAMVLKPYLMQWINIWADKKVVLDSGFINIKCFPDRGAPLSEITSISLPVSFCKNQQGSGSLRMKE